MSGGSATLAFEVEGRHLVIRQDALLQHPDVTAAKVTFRVQEEVFTVPKDLLLKYPETKLCQISELHKVQSTPDDAILDLPGANAERFPYVLEYMETGRVARLPLSLDAEILKQDLIAYGFSNVHLSEIDGGRTHKGKYAERVDFLELALQCYQQVVQQEHNTTPCVRITVRKAEQPLHFKRLHHSTRERCHAMMARFNQVLQEYGLRCSSPEYGSDYVNLTIRIL